MTVSSEKVGICENIRIFTENISFLFVLHFKRGNVTFRECIWPPLGGGGGGGRGGNGEGGRGGRTFESVFATYLYFLQHVLSTLQGDLGQVDA